MELLVTIDAYRQLVRRGPVPSVGYIRPLRAVGDLSWTSETHYARCSKWLNKHVDYTAAYISGHSQDLYTCTSACCCSLGLSFPNLPLIKTASQQKTPRH